ncbi:RGS1-HXK1-interacting protein 1 isoform X2 [Cucumis sativus]|uniref:RGS1-HXK1-interacting protein 1 isoform X2 n=1 Tax=Cucumis sativus TaxID=3659 RepID=UPI0005EC7C4C|nr:RGS1-HXK1-interacting protein 1 isoform X2 [Cucumis sativus]
MAMDAGSSSSQENQSSPSYHHQSSSPKPQSLEDLAKPWAEYAAQQALLYQRAIDHSLESAIEVSKSRLSQIRSTSFPHFQKDSFWEAKSELAAYENLVFGKIRDGILVAASHPLISCGVATGMGFLVFKKPRNFLYYKTIRLFVNEESLLSKADAKVKELRQSIDRIKVESERLEKRTLQAEDELIRGRTKLRQAGKQIEGVIQSAHKIERKARGLKDILADLPTREASRFRTQVSNLASEAKKERIGLSKEVSKISNYGISV